MKQLTENQQQLIAKITEEFMAMNDYPKPTSFADILLDEINQTKREFAAIESKNEALFAELQKQFFRDMEYLELECKKLNIDVNYNPLRRSSDSDYCGTSVWLGDYNAHPHDGKFSISVKVPTWCISRNGMRTHELKPELKYSLRIDKLYDFETLIKSQDFTNSITRIYHQLNKK
jgi:hypothetical protein